MSLRNTSSVPITGWQCNLLHSLILLFSLTQEPTPALLNGKPGIYSQPLKPILLICCRVHSGIAWTPFIWLAVLATVWRPRNPSLKFTPVKQNGWDCCGESPSKRHKANLRKPSISCNTLDLLDDGGDRYVAASIDETLNVGLAQCGNSWSIFHSFPSLTQQTFVPKKRPVRQERVEFKQRKLGIFWEMFPKPGREVNNLSKQ